MKKAVGIILLLFGVYVFWPKNTKVAPAPIVAEDTDSAEEASNPARTNLQVRPTPLPAPTSAALPGTGNIEKAAPIAAASPLETSASDRAKPKRPPPGGLSYVRRGELIVVFGDVLYGKPRDPGAPETGFVAVNPVQIWDEDAIPYYVEPDLPNPERVLKALRYMNEKTPVRFVPFNGQPNAIVFQKGEKDCMSYLGRVGGHQPIKLDANCDVGEILHELMHVLGFVHEQSRSDRDQFVRVNWNQIQPDNRSQFEIGPDEFTRNSMITPFDYQSVMLYRPTAFVIGTGMLSLESKTATPLQPNENALSPGDLERLGKLYGR